MDLNRYDRIFSLKMTVIGKQRYDSLLTAALNGAKCVYESGMRDIPASRNSDPAQ
jgi:hypothetical protein